MTKTAIRASLATLDRVTNNDSTKALQPRSSNPVESLFVTMECEMRYHDIENALISGVDAGGRDRLYVFSSGGLHKIGRSKRVRKRLADIRSMSSMPVKVSAVGPRGTGAAEAAVHRAMAAFRHHGEWFDIWDHGAFMDLHMSLYSALEHALLFCEGY